MDARALTSSWIRRRLPNSADSIQALTYYLWLCFTIVVETLRVYGVDVAAASVLLAVICLLPAARGYRRTKRVTPVFAWGSLAIMSLAVGAIALYLRFER